MLEIITAFLVVLSCVFYFFAKKHSQPFPGPRGIPLCGVAFQVDKEGLHLTLYEWTKKYGEIFQFDVFGKTYVPLNSLEVMREVMGQEPTATITASRESTFFGNYIIAKDTDIIFRHTAETGCKDAKWAVKLCRRTVKVSHVYPTQYPTLKIIIA